jgi:hypothetical protein
MEIVSGTPFLTSIKAPELFCVAFCMAFFIGIEIVFRGYVDITLLKRYLLLSDLSR